MTHARRCAVSGKIRYYTWDDVLHAQLMSARYSGERIWTYICPWCSSWHLTRRPQS